MSNRYVKITKLGIPENPRHATASETEYVYGQSNLKSPPIDYWLTGSLMEEPKVGSILYVARDTRNGVKAEGFFTSSTVTKIEENKYYTLNSIYIIEDIPCPY